MGNLGQLIVVMGVTRSGKSILARKLSSIFDCEHIEFDKLRLQPNYEKRNREQVNHYLNEIITHTDCGFTTVG